jgi:hypothetical protein
MRPKPEMLLAIMTTWMLAAVLCAAPPVAHAALTLSGCTEQRDTPDRRNLEEVSQNGPSRVLGVWLGQPTFDRQ